MFTGNANLRNRNATSMASSNIETPQSGKSKKWYFPSNPNIFKGLVAITLFVFLLGISNFQSGEFVQVRTSWCETVNNARSTLDPSLHIKVPCEEMKPAKSAVVAYITAGVSKEKASRTVFSASDYVDGVMALGASLNDHLGPQTHKLLLLRDDFIPTLPTDVLENLKKDWMDYWYCSDCTY